ncbi:MAG: glycosyltransferase, partial [Lachnospiraceae bacterium]
DYYKAADAFLFASKSETQGIVLLEAFAAGTPAIGVRATGVSDLIQDGVNGFLVPEKMDIFAEKLNILITDSFLCGRLKEGAHSTALAFNESSVAKEALRQYNKIVMEYAAESGNGIGNLYHTNYRRGMKQWKTKTVS